jgi:hypothetical protein
MALGARRHRHGERREPGRAATARAPTGVRGWRHGRDRRRRRASRAARARGARAPRGPAGRADPQADGETATHNRSGNRLGEREGELQVDEQRPTLLKRSRAQVEASGAGRARRPGSSPKRARDQLQSCVAALVATS